MITKIVFILVTFFSFHSFASDFKGCGEYRIKGILRQDKSLKNFFYYSVLENTQSEMKFTIKKVEDLGRILVMLNKPSQFNGKILSLLDGTKGVLQDLSLIEDRFPKPLSPKDTGIEWLKEWPCEK
jgi:hypothetical protein